MIAVLTDNQPDPDVTAIDIGKCAERIYLSLSQAA
jgi:hypothetical protein